MSKVTLAARKTMSPAENPANLLYNAASSGSAKMVKNLLTMHGPILNTQHLKNNSALHIAFMNKHYDIVDLILQAMLATSKFDNLQNSMGLTHLHIACTRKNEKVVQGFLNSGANIKDTVKENSPQWAGFDAMHFAASFQSLQAVKVLLKAGIDPYRKNSVKQTALDLVYKSIADPLIIVDLLDDKRPKDWQKRDLTNFHVACLNEEEDVIQNFIDHGAANMKSKSRGIRGLQIAFDSTPLHCAVASDCIKKVQILLKNGAKVECIDHNNMTPLHLALYNESTSLERGIVIAKEYFPKYNIVDVLYAAIKDKMISHVDKNGLSFFHAAIAANDLSTVKKYLTERKIDVNKPLSNDARSLANHTPLHVAVKFDRLEIGKLLIEHGADVNASDKRYGTPLHMALSRHRHDFIDLFIRKNASLDIKSPEEQNTMLHLLVQVVEFIHVFPSYKNSSNKLDTQTISMFIEQLMKAGVNVNAQNKGGNIALHYFYTRAPFWVIYFQMLLDLGADINIKNNEGKLPFGLTSPWFQDEDNVVHTVIYHHIQKLKALGLDIDPEHDKICKKYLEDENYFDRDELENREKQRQEEIKKLKSITVGDTTSLYNFIRLDDERTMFYAGCKNLKKIAEDEKLKKKFPSYGYLILLKYRAATGFYNNITRKRIHCDYDDEDITYKRQRLE